jgi:hypothetical protein
MENPADNGQRDPNGIDGDFSVYPNTKSGWAQRWTAEFAYAKETHRKWQLGGKMVVNKFLMRDLQANDPFQFAGYQLNLFGINVKTMMDMLFGHVPKVSVDRRHADEKDAIARVASEMASRILNADIEEAGEDFTTIMRSCLQDRLLPGLGCARVRYKMDGDEEKKEKKDEGIDDEYVQWMDVLWSPARTWKEVRWIAFRTYKDKAEMKKFLGKSVTDAELRSIPFNSKNPMEQMGMKTSQFWNKAELWEIWSKEFKYVFWYVEGYTEILKSEADPLELEGFFPCPPFFIANTTTSQYVPKSDYSFAEALYREIDELEERIALLTKAVKVVGVYDKKAGPDIGRMVNETAENKLIPVDAWAVFSERGGIKGSVEFLPIDQIVLALEKLQAQQQSRIQQLYEITGMSDIMRGAADERTQVGTQQLKARFASVRVQAVQDEFTRFATDMQKLRLEIIANFYEPETIIRQANMMFSMDSDNQMLLMQAAQFLKQSEINKWRILISPESMAMTDYSQLRMERTEYINALGIFLQSSYPIAEKFPQATPILLELLKWGLAGFKGSKEIEGVIDRAVAAMQQVAQQGGGQQPPDPGAAKVQAEIQQSQQEHQQKMEESNQKHQLKMAEMQQGFKAEMMEIMARMQESHNKLIHKISGNESDMLTTPPLSLGPTPPQPPAPPGGPVMPGVGNGIGLQ